MHRENEEKKVHLAEPASNTPEEFTESDDSRVITVMVEKISQLETFFTAADVSMQAKYMDQQLGMSDLFPLTDEEVLPVTFFVEIPVHQKSMKCLADLISNPVHFTVYQSAGTYLLDVYPTQAESQEELEYEEILGVRLPEPEAPESEKHVKKSKKGSSKSLVSKKSSENKEDKSTKHSAKDSIKSKTSSKTSTKTKADSKKTSPGKKKADESSSKECSDIKVIGHCTLSLLPFFLGTEEVEEVLPVYQENVYMDERLVAFDNLPRLYVKAYIDLPLFDENVQLTNILSLTIESIYNLPEEFTPGLSYSAATFLPTDEAILKPVLFDSGTYTDEYSSKQFKKWEHLVHIDDKSCFTTEEVVKEPEGIKNKLGVNLSEHFEDKIEDNLPRIEWNILKKCCLDSEANELIKYKLIRNRRWPLEFFVSVDSMRTHDAKQGIKGDKDSKNSSKSSANSGSRKGKRGPTTEPLHLMSFVDVSNLLYPGVKKTRVVSAVQTYKQHEMKEKTGTEDSVFAPNQETVEVDKEKKIEKNNKNTLKGKDLDRSSKSAKNKKPKSKDKVELGDEAAPEPSVQLYNGKGEPTFIIVEMELLHPMFEKRHVEDLSAEIRNMLPMREEVPKYVITRDLAKMKFEDCIKSLIGHIYHEYQKYTGKLPKEKKIQFFTAEIYSFNEHLQKTGRYQEYLTTLLKTVVMYVNEHFDVDSVQKTHRQFENFVSSVYVHLVGNMNKILNGPITCGLDAKPVSPPDSPVSYYFKAREAEEIGAHLLAKRYHNQKISNHARNPDVWLNYAVYQLSLNEPDRAYECVKECLALQITHRYGLMLYAVMLFFRQEWYYAETTFLTLLNYYPRYIEGWVCLYVFYLARENHPGCDICEENLERLSICEEELEKDFITSHDDIAWTTDIYPKGNKFFRTAMILLKLRALKYAEITMGFMPFPTNGELKYYNAVIRYLSQDYTGALVCLKDARKEHGPDFAVNSLIGHCYFKLEEVDKAKEAYEFVVLSFNRPEDMHLLYLNLALIYEREGNIAMTKKYLLHVCKHSPTAYDWLLLGICYFKEESWTFAEECLSEANIQDCYIPETWAYLTLTNLKIGKPWVADQCYQQMIKRDLQNEWLFELVENEIKASKAQT